MHTARPCLSDRSSVPVWLRLRSCYCKFFFNCSGDHRYLHSFPTRRSSDLPLQYMSCSVPIGSGDAGWERGRVGDRSEEHTSELQSRRDLVCRLLLEKKK